ncbi:MAG: leucyl/phenylalanyl-tRNA--protein transferase [Rhizobiales bacterium]|nr:leucyl/phenylalanyl-tRNA--protein transferase [Hyphomicrobiales bacterium]
MSTLLQNVCDVPLPFRYNEKFREPLRARLRRIALGSAYVMQPKRLELVPSLVVHTARHLFGAELTLPALLDRHRPVGRKGFIGISNDMSIDSLLYAYSRGVFPFCHLGPMKWWAPEERAVLFFNKAHIESGTRKEIKRDRFDVTFDRNFAAVMRACAEPRPGKTPLTWLTPRVMRALWDLHKAGLAHSVEVWDLEPRLVGGLFGIAIGGVFFGESQFSRVNGASKIASTFLNHHLADWGFVLRDAKWISEHHAGAGFEVIPRARFNALLQDHTSRPTRRGIWQEADDFDLASAIANQTASMKHPSD